VAYWGLALPLGAALALRKHTGVGGLWAGFAAGAGLQLVALIAVAAAQDWGRQVERSRVLVRSQSSTTAGGAGRGEARGSGGGAAGTPAAVGLAMPLLAEESD
jgi:hypothetical protein